MSRVTAGVGSAIGSVAGGLLGTYGGARFPGHMRPEDSMTAFGLIGALFGGVLGATIGAGSDCPAPKQVGTAGVGEPPRFQPRFP